MTPPPPLLGVGDTGLNDSLLRADKWAIEMSESLGLVSLFGCLLQFYMLLANGRTAPVGFGCVGCLCSVSLSLQQ